MKPFRDHMTSEIAAIDQALDKAFTFGDKNSSPNQDARWEAFVELIESNYVPMVNGEMMRDWLYLQSTKQR